MILLIDNLSGYNAIPAERDHGVNDFGVDTIYGRCWWGFSLLPLFGEIPEYLDLNDE